MYISNPRQETVKKKICNAMRMHACKTHKGSILGNPKLHTKKMENNPHPTGENQLEEENRQLKEELRKQQEAQQAIMAKLDLLMKQNQSTPVHNPKVRCTEDQMDTQAIDTRARRHAAQQSRHILVKERLHPEEQDSLKEVYILIPLPKKKKYQERDFLAHLSETVISENIDKNEEIERLYIQNLTNCHIPTDKTAKQHPKFQEIPRELAKLPRNLVRNAKIPEQGIGPAVLIKGKKGSKILNALIQLGPYLYQDCSCRILAANPAAKQICNTPAENNEKRAATAENAPFWLTDAWIMEEIADPHHLVHNSNIIFWALATNREDKDKQVN